MTKLGHDIIDGLKQAVRHARGEKVPGLKAHHVMVPRALPALSLHQPWASLMAYRAKSIETRDWAPPRKYIGQVMAIHATVRRLLTMDIGSYAVPEMERALGLGVNDWAALPRGAVVATGRLVGAYQAEEWIPFEDAVIISGCVEGSPPRNELVLRPGEPYFGNYEFGRWLWVFEDVIAVDPPIAAKGRQGIWIWGGEANARMG